MLKTKSIRKYYLTETWWSLYYVSHFFRFWPKGSSKKKKKLRSRMGCDKIISSLGKRSKNALPYLSGSLVSKNLQLSLVEH
mmetsp:Transcript_4323/g.6414  ORF Transcript_4323/g.6414 Transcript_4323/m.6414 type:complete len:81 (+) Transcript_4323:129-371(+)